MKNYIMIIATMSLLNAACSSVPKIPDTPAPKALAEYKAPDWVLKGSGA